MDQTTRAERRLEAACGPAQVHLACAPNDAPLATANCAIQHRQQQHIFPSQTHRPAAAEQQSATIVVDHDQMLAPPKKKRGRPLGAKTTKKAVLGLAAVRKQQLTTVSTTAPTAPTQTGWRSPSLDDCSQQQQQQLLAVRPAQQRRRRQNNSTGIQKSGASRAGIGANIGATAADPYAYCEPIGQEQPGSVALNDFRQQQQLQQQPMAAMQHVASNFGAGQLEPHQAQQAHQATLDQQQPFHHMQQQQQSSLVDQLQHQSYSNSPAASQLEHQARFQQQQQPPPSQRRPNNYPHQAAIRPPPTTNYCEPAGDQIQQQQQQQRPSMAGEYYRSPAGEMQQQQQHYSAQQQAQPVSRQQPQVYQPATQSRPQFLASATNVGGQRRPQQQQYYPPEPMQAQCYEAPTAELASKQAPPPMEPMLVASPRQQQRAAARVQRASPYLAQQPQPQMQQQLLARPAQRSLSNSSPSQQQQQQAYKRVSEQQQQLLMNPQQQPHLVPPPSNGYPAELAGRPRYASQQPHGYLEHQEQQQYNGGSAPTLLQQQLSNAGAANSPSCRPQDRLTPGAANNQRQHQLDSPAGCQLPPAKRAPPKLGPTGASNKRDQLMLGASKYPTPPQHQQLIGNERALGGHTPTANQTPTALEQSAYQQQRLPSADQTATTTQINNNTQLLASQAADASQWSQQQQHHAALANDGLQQQQPTSAGYNNGGSSLMQAGGINKLPPPQQAYQQHGNGANYSQQEMPPNQHQRLLVGGQQQLNGDHHLHQNQHHHHQHQQQNTIIERTMPKNHVNAIQQQQYIATNSNNNHNGNIVMNQHHNLPQHQQHQQQHYQQAPATSRGTNIPMEPVLMQPIPAPPASSASSLSPQILPATTPIAQQSKPVCGDQLSIGDQLASGGPTGRLSLPLHNVPLLLGPFKLDFDAQFTTKVFHINSQLFDSLSRSMKNPQSNVIQELQFRAHPGQINTNDPNFNAQHHHQCRSSQAAAARLNNNGLCNWPELFQVYINQNLVRLDRSRGSSGGSIAASIFQYCQLGDNYLEIQANDCYCTHEFVMEAVDRPTIKAFMSSCFKSCVLETEKCIQKLKFNFGSPGFINQLFQQQQQQQHQLANIINEYITEQSGGGIKQTRIRISLRCPISGKRMRTPTRGQDCKHLQCFDLENFLHLNLDRSRWNCPICSNGIPFNMLELDQHQLNVVQSMSDVPNTDDILMDPVGQWRAYYSPPTIMAGSPAHLNPPPPAPHIQHPPPPHHQPNPNQHQHQVHHLHHHHQMQQQPQCPPIVPPPTMGAGAITARSTGTYHPQAPMSMNGGAGNNRNGPIVKQQPQRPPAGPMRPMSCNSPAPWETVRQQPAQSIEPQQQPIAGNNRRPSTRAAPRAGSGSPLATTGMPQRYQDHHQHHSSSPSSSSFQSARNSPATMVNANLIDHQGGSSDLDNLSPLAAMERTIIQHEQQMGPPPFDPNSFAATSISSTTPPSQQQQQQQQQLRGSPLATSASSANVAGNSTSNSMISQPNVPPQQQQSSPATSCRTESRMSGSATGCYSPVSRKLSSPQSSSRLVSGSPQLQLQQQPHTPIMAQTRGPSTEPVLPQSPSQHQIQQQHQVQQGGAISTPSTPLSCMMFHGSVEGGPATPYQGQHCAPNSVPASHQQQQFSSGQQPASVGSTTVVTAISANANATNVNGQQQQPGCVDHQPLSNGSASIGSINSASTLTPSGQSLGSNGMGGDSRCATAPLGQQGSHQQNHLGSPSLANSLALRLDDMLMSSSASQHQQHLHHNHHQVGSAATAAAAVGTIGQQTMHLQSSSVNHFSSAGAGQAQFAKQQTAGGYVEAAASSPSLMQHQHGDVKNEILVSKLMAESSESLLKDPRNAEVAMALEEAEWKQMLDSQGRNVADNGGQFSSSLLLSNEQSSLQNKQQCSIAGQQGQQQQNQSQRGTSKSTSNKNEEPDAGQRSEHELSPSQNEFANYLEAGDGGACLPPDYSIFDLFER